MIYHQKQRFARLFVFNYLNSFIREQISCIAARLNVPVNIQIFVKIITRSKVFISWFNVGIVVIVDKAIENTKMFGKFKIYAKSFVNLPIVIAIKAIESSVVGSIFFLKEPKMPFSNKAVKYINKSQILNIEIQ